MPLPRLGLKYTAGSEWATSKAALEMFHENPTAGIPRRARVRTAGSRTVEFTAEVGGKGGTKVAEGAGKAAVAGARAVGAAAGQADGSEGDLGW